MANAEDESMQAIRVKVNKGNNEDHLHFGELNNEILYLDPAYVIDSSLYSYTVNAVEMME